MPSKKVRELVKEARECKINSSLERDQARIDRLIAQEERRRKEENSNDKEKGKKSKSI